MLSIIKCYGAITRQACSRYELVHCALCTHIRRRADVRQWEKGKLSEHGKVSLASEQTLTFVSDNFGVIFQLVRRRVIIIRNFWGARLTLKDEWTTVGVFGCRVGRTRTGVASLRVRTNPAMKCTMSTVAHLPLSLYAPCNL